MPPSQVPQTVLHESDDFDDELVYKTDNSVLLGYFSIAFAEYIGTAIIVFVSCMGCTFGMSEGTISTLQLSLISGLGVMTAIQIFGHISGALVNPAVTLCALIMGQISITAVPIYVGAQIAGSVTGYALLMAVTPKQYLKVDSGHCVTTPSPEISLLQAVVVEAIATSIMCFAICSSWDPRNSKRTDSVPLKIGLIVVVLGLAAGPYTGGCMNPARSFAPAVMNKVLDTHLVYWVGPIIGAVLTGICYRAIFLEKNNNK